MYNLNDCEDKHECVIFADLSARSSTADIQIGSTLTSLNVNGSMCQVHAADGPCDSISRAFSAPLLNNLLPKKAFGQWNTIDVHAGRTAAEPIACSNDCIGSPSHRRGHNRTSSIARADDRILSLASDRSSIVGRSDNRFDSFVARGDDRVGSLVSGQNSRTASLVPGDERMSSLPRADNRINSLSYRDDRISSLARGDDRISSHHARRGDRLYSLPNAAKHADNLLLYDNDRTCSLLEGSARNRLPNFGNKLPPTHARRKSVACYPLCFERPHSFERLSDRPAKGCLPTCPPSRAKLADCPPEPPPMRPTGYAGLERTEADHYIMLYSYAELSVADDNPDAATASRDVCLELAPMSEEEFTASYGDVTPTNSIIPLGLGSTSSVPCNEPSNLEYNHNQDAMQHLAQVCPASAQVTAATAAADDSGDTGTVNEQFNDSQSMYLSIDLQDDDCSRRPSYTPSEDSLNIPDNPKIFYNFHPKVIESNRRASSRPDDDDVSTSDEEETTDSICVKVIMDGSDIVDASATADVTGGSDGSSDNLLECDLGAYSCEGGDCAMRDNASVTSDGNARDDSLDNEVTSSDSDIHVDMTLHEERLFGKARFTEITNVVNDNCDDDVIANHEHVRQYVDQYDVKPESSIGKHTPEQSDDQDCDVNINSLPSSCVDSSNVATLDSVDIDIRAVTVVKPSSDHVSDNQGDCDAMCDVNGYLAVPNAFGLCRIAEVSCSVNEHACIPVPLPGCSESEA